MNRLTIAACVIVMLSGFARRVAADDIPCPVQHATWEVTTPVPEPWSRPVEVGTLAKRFSAFINGRDWIICRYANGNDPMQISVFRLRTGYGISWVFQLRLTRPAFSNAHYSEIDCPVRQVRAQLKTDVPSPWTSTTYVFHQVAKEIKDPAISGSIECVYETRDQDVWAAGPSALLRPVKPDTGPGLAPNPKPAPRGPDQLTAEFGVTAVTLSTPAEVRAACPASVKFRGFITANGAGIVRYRIVHNGAPGVNRQLEFDRAEGRPVLFDVEVGGGSSAGSVTARPKPVAPGTMTAAPPPANRISGWARIEILAPRAGVERSDIAPYVVSCTAAGPGRIRK